jgi:hypothetical protein
MARKITLFLLLLSLSAFMAGTGHAQVKVNLGPESPAAYHGDLGRFYGVPVGDVQKIKAMKIHDDELPVAMFIANRARVSPQSVAAMRLGGKSWLDVSVHFGLGPQSYYVPVRTVSGPPYGKAYGYYRNKPRNQWGTIVLSDPDIINLANLRFLAEFHGMSPDRIVAMRSRGNNFIHINSSINSELKGKKGDWKPGKEMEDRGKPDDNPGMESGKGNKHGGKDDPGKGNSSGKGQGSQGKGKGKGK